MALVVETGSVVDGANTFVSQEEAIDMAADYNIALPDDDTTGAMILQAGDLLRGITDWKGELVSDLQEMPFPRTNVYVGKTLWDSTVIPLDLKKAQVQLVIAMYSQDLDFNSVTPGGVVTERTVGPITTKFSDKYGQISAVELDDIPAVTNALLRWRTGEETFVEFVRG